MSNTLLAIDGAFKTFFTQLTDSIGYDGFLAIALGVEALFILLFVIKSVFSYEARLKYELDRVNAWLFKVKKIDTSNIRVFNALVKRGPKRFVYYWQQYILYREGGPSNYMSAENIIEKPLRTSSWKNNVKNLGVLTVVWAIVTFVFALASQYTPQTVDLTFQATAVALVIPALVILLGVIAMIFIRGKRVLNLDDIYHLYHLFARFIDNACADLPEFIDFDLLFTKKEIEKGNSQLREYYEARARKAKEEFENARKHEINFVEFNFENVGVDGKLLLNRAMKESETYISKKTAAEARMAQVEAQKDALRRSYENVQMDLQRKIQVSKENIQKLIEQQLATTSRVEVGLLRQQQEKEVSKQEALQKDYDAEEAKYKREKEERDEEIEQLRLQLDESLASAERGMSAEYQTFFEKVMKSAYAVAERQADLEKKEITRQRDQNEAELVNVQTQIKRLFDENNTLRAKIEELTAQKIEQNQPVPENDGHYDQEGNYIYADGSYHDTKGLFHDVDGKIYDMNGVLVGENENEISDEEKQQHLVEEQVEKFGSYIPTETEAEETVTPAQEQLSVEDTNAPLETMEQTETQVEEANEELEENLVQPVEEKQIEEAVSEITDENSLVDQPETQIVDQPEVQTIERTEEKIAEQPSAENKETPTKKRGRPKKQAKDNNSPAKKRGRPRKVEEKVATSPAKRGRPRKKNVPAEEKPKAQRGRPKKVKTIASTTNKNQPARRGRPKKTEGNDTLSKINKLINDEEAKLSRMKALLNSEIDHVMDNDFDQEVEKEKDELMEAVETIKEQANDVRSSEKSNEELASINNRLEDLINEISVLNNKK